jgi:hypothetical protein
LTALVDGSVPMMAPPVWCAAPPLPAPKLPRRGCGLPTMRALAARAMPTAFSVRNADIL